MPDSELGFFFMLVTVHERTVRNPARGYGERNRFVGEPKSRLGNRGVPETSLADLSSGRLEVYCPKSAARLSRTKVQINQAHNGLRGGFRTRIAEGIFTATARARR